MTPPPRKRHRYQYRRGRVAICIHCGTKRRPTSSGYEYMHPIYQMSIIVSSPNPKVKPGSKRRWWASNNPPCSSYNGAS